MVYQVCEMIAISVQLSCTHFPKILYLEQYIGEGNGKPLQYSCREMTKHSGIQISGKTLSLWMSVSEFKHDAVVASQGIMELSHLQGKDSQN